MFFNGSTKNKGFTMLEMIIAIFVFLTGIIGVYLTIQSFYTTAIFSSNRLIASYLSQEGIELIKNIRDTNLIAGNLDWKSNIIGIGTICPGGVNNTCKIGYNDSPSMLALDSSSGSFLKKDASGFYNYNGPTGTIFKRKIIVTSFTSPADYINVSVETEWYKKDSTTKEGSVKVEDNLYGYWQ